jgi:dTDP-4-amino-4,6-dideoxygalactose transaminase
VLPDQNIDPDAVARAITPRTRALLPVHLTGRICRMDQLASIAAAHGLMIVEDAAQAIGSRFAGRPSGSFGRFGCFSAHPLKNLNALGDAGAVVTDDAALTERLRQLRSHGWDRRFHSSFSALNSRMDEIHAAVLRLKLPKLDAWNNRRRAIGKRYHDALKGTSVKPAPHAPWAEPSYYLYVVRTQQRDELLRCLAEAGIATDVHWPEPPHLQPAYEHLGYGPGSLPVTERLCNEVVTIPMFPELTDDEVERVASTLHRFATA